MKKDLIDKLGKIMERWDHIAWIRHKKFRRVIDAGKLNELRKNIRKDKEPWIK